MNDRPSIDAPASNIKLSTIIMIIMIIRMAPVKGSKFSDFVAWFSVLGSWV